MALPLLVNGGAECGPINPLQLLSKTFDQDRSTQQDFYRTTRPGPSTQTFRTQAPLGDSDLNAEATRFFTGSGSGQPFDISALRTALVPHPLQENVSANENWAGDFLVHEPSMLKPNSSHWPGHRQGTQAEILPNHIHRQALPLITGPTIDFRPSLPQQHALLENAFSDVESASRWDALFKTHETILSSQPIQKQPEPVDADELAKAAGFLVDSVKSNLNPKFKNSVFLGLMRQLRDREVVVEGNTMVSAPIEMTRSTDKGKAKAVDPSFVIPTRRRKSVHFEDRTPIQEALLDEDDAFWKQENADYQRFWAEADARRSEMIDAGQKSAQDAEWDMLQDDWDRWEATSVGVKPLTIYQFQENNPYLVGDSSRTRHHVLHDHQSSTYDTVLEKEAAVQLDSSNAKAWYELGIKQQENERENKATEALTRAVELDPEFLPAHLALAISHANDGDRNGTFDSIFRWIRLNEKYAGFVHDFGKAMSPTEKQKELVEALMAIARATPGGEIDPDIQIALGVLLNAGEVEYEKAQDCFRAALAVRPDDPVLYNRVGATLANSGNSQSAIEYYHHALSLNPSYIRARFNLGISCINLMRYHEAAQHILDALVLQESEMRGAIEDKRGVTSSALWDCLKRTCRHLHRSDLATLTELKDLDRFRLAFYADEGKTDY